MAQGKPVTSFYILSGDNHYELDATTSISVTESNQLTTNPIQSGRSVSDHAINNNSTISFSGKISSIKSVQFKSKKRVDSVEDFLRSLKQLRKDRSIISVFVTDEIEPYRNCIITSLNLNQESGQGSFKVSDAQGQTVKGGSSWDISITFEQFESAQLARPGLVERPIPDEERENQAGEGSEFGDAASRGPIETLGLQSKNSAVFRGIQKWAGSLFVGGSSSGPLQGLGG